MGPLTHGRVQDQIKNCNEPFYKVPRLRLDLSDCVMQAWCCDKCPGEPDRWSYVGTTKNSRLYLRMGQGYQRYEKYGVSSASSSSCC